MIGFKPHFVHMAQGLGGRNLCGSEEFGGRGLGLEVSCLDPYIQWSEVEVVEIKSGSIILF